MSNEGRETEGLQVDNQENSNESSTPPEAKQNASDRAWRPGDRLQVAVVSFSHTIQHGYVAALGVAYPFVLADFHVSYAVLGIILGAAGIVGGLLQGLAAVVRKYSTRVLLGSQNLGMALSLVITAVSPSFILFWGCQDFRHSRQLASTPGG